MQANLFLTWKQTNEGHIENKSKWFWNRRLKAEKKSGNFVDWHVVFIFTLNKHLLSFEAFVSNVCKQLTSNNFTHERDSFKYHNFFEIKALFSVSKLIIPRIIHFLIFQTELRETGLKTERRLHKNKWWSSRAETSCEISRLSAQVIGITSWVHS